MFSISSTSLPCFFRLDIQPMVLSMFRYAGHDTSLRHLLNKWRSICAAICTLAIKSDASEDCFLLASSRKHWNMCIRARSRVGIWVRHAGGRIWCQEHPTFGSRVPSALDRSRSDSPSLTRPSSAFFLRSSSQMDGGGSLLGGSRFTYSLLGSDFRSKRVTNSTEYSPPTRADIDVPARYSRGILTIRLASVPFVPRVRQKGLVYR
mmetsp:Transcript_7207/g.17541  ORF Transcript_7207/g.17541 Transcript_7207/m.17541 type:complete len:206 (+) Transcript_7207:204-821(+)